MVAHPAERPGGTGHAHEAVPAFVHDLPSPGWQALDVVGQPEGSVRGSVRRIGKGIGHDPNKRKDRCKP